VHRVFNELVAEHAEFFATQTLNSKLFVDLESTYPDGQPIQIPPGEY